MISFVCSQIFFLISPAIVQAFSYPSPNEVAADMEDDDDNEDAPKAVANA